jgi:hypothetical protein
MRPDEVIRMIEEGWGFRLPGERSLYWNPRDRVPQNHIELYMIGGGCLTWYLVRVPPGVIEEAWRIREVLQGGLEDLRYPAEILEE